MQLHISLVCPNGQNQSTPQNDDHVRRNWYRWYWSSLCDRCGTYRALEIRFLSKTVPMVNRADCAFAKRTHSSGIQNQSINSSKSQSNYIYLLTFEIMSPCAVRTWYKYRYFRCLASSFVSGTRFFDERPRLRAFGSPGAPNWEPGLVVALRSVAIRGRCWKCGAPFLWSTCQAVMKLCTSTPTIITTGHINTMTPPQQGGGAGFGFIVIIWK